MLERFKFLCIYFFIWVVFFEASRVLFLLYHFSYTSQLPLATAMQTLLYGLRLDLSMASYIALPVCLLVGFSFLIPLFQKTIIYTIYTAIILLFVLLLVIADLELYKQWGFRIDATPLKYLASPKEAWASVSHLPVFWILLLLVAIYVVLLLIFKRVLHKSIFSKQMPKRWGISLILILAFIGLLGVLLRGGLQLAPINQSSVYFSTHNFANHASINATWNFLHSIIKKEGNDSNPYLFYSEKQTNAIVDSLYKANGSIENVLNTKNPNVLLIIWESFTEKSIHLRVDGKEVTPGFNQLRKEGLYFSHVYASGDRTDKGLSAILSGYPALPKTSIIRTPNKSAKLRTLSQIFKEKKYQTAFYYGGEPEFANIKSYLLNGGFEKIIQEDDFSKKDQNSKWGAHDGVVANRLLADLNRNSVPFFTTWLTLSSHEPYETPEPVVIKGDDYTHQFLNSLHYTDKVLTNFIHASKKQPWWTNTLIIIIADHSHGLPETGKQIDNYKIPMLWLGGALQKSGQTINKVIAQTDVASTLAAQIGVLQNPFPFGKNFFDSTAKAWSFFSFNNGFGMVQDSQYVIFDHIGKQVIERNGLAVDHMVQSGKALQQFIYSDFIRK